MRALRNPRSKRRGTTAVEVAVVLPIFFTFLWGLLEIGHGMWVQNMIKGACRSAARHGSAEDVTTEDVEDHIVQYLSSSLNTEALTISVKDARVFDTEGPYPETSDEWGDLADVEVSLSGTGDLFVVRTSVSFNAIAFMPLPFTNGVTLEGHSITRHE